MKTPEEQRRLCDELAAVSSESDPRLTNDVAEAFRRCNEQDEKDARITAALASLEEEPLKEGDALVLGEHRGVIVRVTEDGKGPSYSGTMHRTTGYRSSRCRS